MSIMFLEPVHPEPGHTHHGQLQLVEVSGAGRDPRPFCTPAWPRKGQRGHRTAVPTHAGNGPGAGAGPGWPHPRLAVLFSLSVGNAPAPAGPWGSRWALPACLSPFLSACCLSLEGVPCRFRGELSRPCRPLPCLSETSLMNSAYVFALGLKNLSFVVIFTSPLRKHLSL